MSDPKPCPFCGATEISDGEVLTEHDGTTYTQSECQGCGALGPRGHLLPGEVDYGDAKAIEAWNRRAQPAQAGQVLTADEIDSIAKPFIRSVGDHWCNEPAIREQSVEDLARAIESAVLARVARVPMTEDEIEDAARGASCHADLVRAVERHYGIAQQKGPQ